MRKDKGKKTHPKSMTLREVTLQIPGKWTLEITEDGVLSIKNVGNYVATLDIGLSEIDKWKEL